MNCSMPGLPVHHQLLEFTQTVSSESVMPSNHLILCRSLLLLLSIFPSIRVFSNQLALCIRWPKYWSFSFSIHPSSEYSGLISFRMDWLDLLAVQGTLLLQHHSSEASILRHSAFFTVQLSYPYMATGKTIASWSFSQWLPKAFCLSQRESVTVSSEVLWWESPTSIPAFSSLSVTVLRRTTRTRGCALGMILWTEEPFMALAQSRVHTHPAQQSLMPRRRKPLGVRGKPWGQRHHRSHTGGFWREGHSQTKPMYDFAWWCTF